MNDELKTVELKNFKKDSFSKISIALGLIALLAYGIYLFTMPPEEALIGGNAQSLTWLVEMVILACFFGIIFNIISLIKKEQLKYLMIGLLLFNIVMLF